MRAILLEKAIKNLEILGKNRYPGRGFIFGPVDEYLVIVYWIMGRSEGTRNRRFEKDEKTGRLWTEIADPSKLKEGEDTSLLLYNAMREDSGLYVVSNGKQTDDVINAYCESHIHSEVAFRQAMFENEYEYDDNFTPRISAAFYLNPAMQPAFRYAEMSIIKKLGPDKDIERSFYYLKNLLPGIGHCIHTYKGDGNPLPAFDGEPYPLPLNGDIETITRTYWDVLNFDNLVSLATKFINMETGKSEMRVINKY